MNVIENNTLSAVSGGIIGGGSNPWDLAESSQLANSYTTYTYDDGSTMTVDPFGDPVSYSDAYQTPGSGWSPNWQMCGAAIASTLGAIGAAARGNMPGAYGAAMAAAISGAACIEGR